MSSTMNMVISFRSRLSPCVDTCDDLYGTIYPAPRAESVDLSGLNNSEILHIMASRLFNEKEKQKLFVENEQ